MDGSADLLDRAGSPLASHGATLSLDRHPSISRAAGKGWIAETCARFWAVLACRRSVEVVPPPPPEEESPESTPESRARRSRFPLDPRAASGRLLLAAAVGVFG